MGILSTVLMLYEHTYEYTSVYAPQLYITGNTSRHMHTRTDMIVSSSLDSIAAAAATAAVAATITAAAAVTAAAAAAAAAATAVTAAAAVTAAVTAACYLPIDSCREGMMLLAATSSALASTTLYVVEVVVVVSAITVAIYTSTDVNRVSFSVSQIYI